MSRLPLRLSQAATAAPEAGARAAQGAVAYERLKVFISYSRHDARFAAEIRAGLEYDGRFETLIDSQSIHEGEEWKARISALIAESATVVVVLSAHWLASEICRWELEQAWLHSKRVVPVQYVPLAGLVVPPRLAVINYVRFDEAPDGTPRLLMEGMQALRRTLMTDLGWVREHARLMAKAAEWDAAGRVGNRMLAGADISAAKAWLDARPSGAPEPTELHRDFIAASEQAEVARLSAEHQRAETLRRAYVRARAALVLACIGAVLAGAAGLFAHGKKLEAEKARAQAVSERDGALLVQSRHLADIAAAQLAASDPGTALQLALAGLPDPAPQALPQALPGGPAASGSRGALQGRDGRGARPYLAQIEGRVFEAALADAERAVLAGHGGPVLGLAYSADGRQLATAGEDGGVRLWDAQSAELLHLFEGRDGPVTSVAFSPDGHHLVLGSGSQVQVLDLQKRQPLRALATDGDSVLGVAFSGDGRRIVAGLEGGSARVWDAASGQPVATLSGHGGPVAAVAINATGSQVITGSDDATAALWDVAGAPRRLLARGHALAVSAVAWSPDASRFATVAADNAIRIWAGANGRLLRQIGPLDQTLHGLAFSSDGRQLAAGAADGSVQVWDAESGGLWLRLAGHTAPVNAVSWSSDGQHLASASKDGTARIWSLAPGFDSLQRAGQGLPITSVGVSADGRRIAAAERGGPLLLLDERAAGLTPAPGGPALQASSVALSADGTSLLTGGADGAAQLWRLKDPQAGWQPAQELKGHERAVISAALSAGGRRAATGSDDMMARVWDGASGKLLAAMGPHATRVTSLAFDSSGERLLTGSGTTARLWNALSGESIAVFSGAAGSVLAVALSPDGRLAAAGSRDGSVRVWSVSGGALLHRLAAGTAAAASGIAFSSDGARIVSGWSDGRLRIWDVRSGEPIADAPLHAEAILALGLAAEGRRLVSADAAGNLRATPLMHDTAALVRWARAKATRCLTPRQLKAFHLGAAPPRWCITGAAGVDEVDAAKWRALWPYQGPRWRDAQLAADRGENPTWPQE